MSHKGKRKKIGLSFGLFYLLWCRSLRRWIGSRRSRSRGGRSRGGRRSCRLFCCWLHLSIWNFKLQRAKRLGFLHRGQRGFDLGRWFGIDQQQACSGKALECITVPC